MVLSPAIVLVLLTTPNLTSYGSATSPLSLLSVSSIKRRMEQVDAGSYKNPISGAVAPAQLLRTPSGLLAREERKLESSCDVAFLKCLPSEECLTCFDTMGDEGIDWAGVSSATPCSEIVELLTSNGHCKSLATNAEGKEAFCDTFNSCVHWGDDDDFHERGPDGMALDCSKLKKCEWDGMHENFLGDGICQQLGCYNTEICNWDHGDCCQDTCESTEHNECGVDGFECRDPKSSNCVPALNPACAKEPTPAPKHFDKCDGNDKLYALEQFDSWGDGWDLTKLTLKDKNEKVLYDGKLEKGHAGFQMICLGKGCYSVSVSGGLWGNEVTWKLRQADGGPYLAFGGSPMDCTFPLEGNECENTCNGKASDSSEAVFPECVHKKCVLQLGTCMSDDDCSPCLVKDPPQYCYTNDKFNAFVDCGICRCPEDAENVPEYCQDKGKEKGAPDLQPGGGSDGANWDSRGRKCSAQETLLGSSAVMSYAKCSDIDGTDAMMQEWNLNNFGSLDKFESCARRYKNDPLNHAGNTALGCMQLLTEIVDGASEDPEYVKSVATHLYKTPQSICDCSLGANKECPSCAEFSKFKTLLMESLDACNALDWIDCAAWEEFSRPCKDNISAEFGQVDFAQKKHCEFVENGCRDVGPFPAFRRLDCGKEISKVSWDFYYDYSKGCLEDSKPDDKKPDDKKPDPGQKPAPKPDPAEPNPAPEPVPESKPSNTSTPYIPPEDDPYNPSSASVRSNRRSKFERAFLWLFVAGGICGGVYYAYKKKKEASFGFVRYQQQTQTEDSLGQELFSGMGSGSFQPATLPQQPSPAV